MNIRFLSWLNKINVFKKRIDHFPDIIQYGKVISYNGLILEVIGVKASVGSICIVEYTINDKILYTEGEVIGFKKEKIFIILFQEKHNILPGSRVLKKCINNCSIKRWPLGFQLLGRVLDSQGKPLDKRPLNNITHFDALHGFNINPFDRKPINKIFDTGIRSINALLTVGIGQRMGILSNSGNGKSILLGMMTKFAKADVIVIGLIGERGREVKEFIQDIIGPSALSRSVVIVEPADVSPILKIQGAMYAIKIAEYFRDHNKNVLFILDSLTRYAMAQREISLSMGEIPVNKGYPSSIFSKLSNFIERSGNHFIQNGSITSFYTILTEEDEMGDPVSKISKSVLDGHIILSKLYSDSGHYPAIDVELSISRLMYNLVGSDQYKKVMYLKKLVSAYHKGKDLINIGAYISGSDALLDHAIQLWPKIESFLQQSMFNNSSYQVSISDLKKII